MGHPDDLQERKIEVFDMLIKEEFAKEKLTNLKITRNETIIYTYFSVFCNEYIFSKKGDNKSMAR